MFQCVKNAVIGKPQRMNPRKYTTLMIEAEKDAY